MVEVIKDGCGRAVGSAARSLEIVTRNLDKHLPMIGASEMPEYEAALKSINSYRKAVQRKIDELNNEDKIR